MRQDYKIIEILTKRFLTALAAITLCLSTLNGQNTQCDVMSAPIVESFDDYGTGTDVLPLCWVRQKNYDDVENRYPQITGAQYVSSPGSLLMFCGNNAVGGHWALAIGPEMSNDITSLYVRFKMRCASANAKIEVGVCTDTSLYDNGFVPLDTLYVSAANTWEEKVATLSDYSGNGNRIAFRMMRSLQPGNSLTIYVDDLVIEPCGVWHISRQERGINDFYVQWDNIGLPTVDIEIGPVDFTPGTGTMHTDVVSPYHFTGLEPGTTYQLRFYSNCGGITREQPGINATTLTRDARELNLCETFENNGDNIPIGWRRPTTYDNTPRAYTSAARTGSRGLFFRPSNNGTKPIAVLPMIDTVDIDQLTVTFWLRSNNYNTGYIEIGVMEYPEYPSSFVPVDTVSANTTWSAKKVSLHGYSGNGKYISFRAYDANTNYNYLYMDNLQVGPCIVTGWEATNIAAHRMEIRWDTVGPYYHGDSVTVEYGPAGFATGSGTTVRVPVRGSGVQTVGGKQKITVSGLTADSDYELVIFGECDYAQQHCVFSRQAAHTLEADIALPYCQTFDGMATGGLPAGWSRPVMYNSRPRIWNSQNRSGDRSLQLYARGNLSYEHSVAVMPMFDVDSVRGLTVSFYSYGTNSYNPRIQVGVMDNPNDESTFTVVATISLANGSWNRHVTDLSSYTGTGRYLAFRYYHENCNSCGYDAYIDDIVVSDASSTNSTVYSISSHSASFKWMGLGRAYAGGIVEWGPSGFEYGTGHRDTILSASPTDVNGYYHYSIDTLQPGTTYNFFISALSGDADDICTYTRQSFTTATEPMRSSYCYGFEDLNNDGFPSNWKKPSGYDMTPKATSSEYFTGSKSLYLRCDRSCNYTLTPAFAVMPFLEEDNLDGLTLRFYAKANNNSPENRKLAIGFMSDNNDPSSFVGLDTLSLTTSWEQYSIDLSQYSGAARNIAFNWFVYNNSCSCCAYSAYIDDITINRCRVTNVSSLNNMSTSFTVQWTNNGGIDSVEVEYGPQGFTPGSGSTVSTSDATTSAITLTGLTPGTTYDYYVRPYCTGSGDVCSETKHTASTLSQAVAHGWCEDFEAYTYPNRPSFWTTLQNHEYHPFVYNHSDATFYTSPISAFEFRCSPTGPTDKNLIAMPAAEEDVAGLVLSFNIRCTDAPNPSRPMLIVGVMTNPYDSTTFAPVDTVRPTYNYRRVSVSMASYSGTGRHIAFRYRDDGYRYTYIDDLHLSHCVATCLQATQVSDQSVSLVWQRMGYSDSTTIAYSTGNGQPQYLRTDGTSVTIDNLQPGTTYRFHAWGSCQDSSLTCQAEEISVTTLDSPLEIPYCETFEGIGVNAMPNGWAKPVDVPDLGICDIPHNGQRSLRLTTRGIDPRVSYAAMPPLETDDISAVYFEAWIYTDHPQGSLTVGIMSNPNDTSTFTAIETFTPVAPAWTHIHCSFASYSGTGACIAFRAMGGDDGQHYIYVDDINLRSCAVTLARAITPTENSITLQWATSSAPQAAVVEYAPTGSNAGDFLPGAGTTITVTESPYTFTGLEEATWYAFHVYPICDTVSDGCNYEITTLETLHPWVDLPYCENFESINSALPNNWLNLSTDYNPQRDFTYHGHDSVESNYTLLHASSTDSALFVLPRIYIGGQCPVLDRLYANFWTYGSGNVADGIFEVGVMTDANDPTTFTAHDTVEPLPDVWQHHIVSIANYNTASQYVAFRFRSANGAAVNCAFDDLCMEKCVAADVTVSNITQNSVTITWNNYSVDTLVCEYGPTGYQLGSGTVVTITESPYVLTGLSDGSQYEFTFASVCGCDQYGSAYTPGGGSWGGSGGWGGGGWGWHCCVPCYYDSTNYCRWWGWGHWHGHSWSWWYSQGSGGNWVTPPVIDITTQAAMLETPYCESFEINDTVAFPPSWRRKTGSHYPDITTTNHHSGDNSMRFYSTPGNRCHAALPPLNMGEAAGMVMTFFAYSTSVYATGSNARFYVGVMTDPDNLSTFVKIDSVSLTNIATWEQFAVNFASYSGEGQYLAFLFEPVGAAYNMYLDDIYLGPCAISGTTLIPSGSNVQVSWTSHNTPDRVLIQYGPQGTTPDDTTVSFRSVYATSSPTNVTIDADSSYDFFVSAICNDTATGSCLVEPITVNPSMLLPYCDNFDGYPNSVVPDDWKILRRTSNSSAHPCVETNSGRQVLTINTNTGDNNTVVLFPPLPYGNTLSGKWINVVMSLSGNSAYLDFGYLTDTNLAGSFVLLGTLTGSTYNQYLEQNLQLSADAAANRLAVRARSVNGERWIRLDRFVVSNYAYPTGITTTAYGVARREIRWNNNSGNANFTLEYGYGDNWRQVASDSCRAILTELQPDKDYQVFFIAPDGERLCLPYTFHNESYMPIPYCDNFDSYDNLTVPPLWYSYSSFGDNYPRTYDNCYNSCCRTMDFYSNKNNNQYTALPDFDVDSIRNLDLQFSLRIEQTNYTKLQIGVMDDRTDYSTFVPVDTLTCSSNSTHYKKHINLSRYHGNGRYVAFRMMTTSSSRTSIFLDDLVVSACPLPDYTVVGSTTVKTEVPHVSDADYYIEYAPRSFTQGERDTLWNTDSSAYTLQNVSTIVHVTENPFYIEGLNPATAYTFYARCDSLASTCAVPVTITTSGRLPIPYCENFDQYNNYSYPTNWHRYMSRSGYDYPQIHSNKHLHFYCYQNDICQIAMPDLDVDSIKHLDLTFNMMTRYSQYAGLIIGVLSDFNNWASFVPIDTIRNVSTSDAWESKHVSLNRYNGNGRFLAFRMINTNGWRECFIDDMRFQSCPRPTAALVAGTTVRFDIDTTVTPPDYWIEYGPQGMTQLAEDTVWNTDSSTFTIQPHNTIFHVTETPFFITGLNENTTYDFYSRCDSAVGTCVPTHRITTTFVLPLPYCDEFNSYGYGSQYMATGWIRYHSDSYYNNSDRYPRTTYGYDNYSVIRFYNRSGQTCYTAMPDIDVDSIRNLSIILSMRSEYRQYTQLEIGVMDNPNDLSTFTHVETLQNTIDNWQTFTVNMSSYNGSGRFVAFRMLSTYSGYRVIDLDLVRIQSCPRPSASLSAGTTVRFDVDTTASAPDYWIEYGPQGMAQLTEDTVWNTDSSAYTIQPHNTIVHVTETPFFITGLNPGTTYDFYSRCDSAISTCFPTHRITTSAVMSVPTCFDFSSYANYTTPPFWNRYSSETSSSYSSYPYIYDHYMYFYRSSGNTICQSVLPDFDIDSIKNLNLTFYITSDYINDGVVVGVMTDPNNIATFTPVDTLLSSATQVWEQVKPRLYRYNGIGRFVALRQITTNTYHRVGALGFTVESCDIPANATATLHGSRTVRIDASRQSGTGFIVEYGPQNFTQGEATLVQVNQLPLDLELDYNSTYDFYFRCDTNTLTCRPKQTVTTLSAPSPLPLCENFESYGINNMPTSWSMIRDNNNYGNIYVYNSNANDGSRSLRFYCYYNYSNYAILPDMAVDSLKDISISLWLKGPSGSSIVVGAMSDPNDKYSFIPVRTLSCDNDTYKRHILNFSSLPNDARFISFRSNTPNSCCWRNLFIDDLYIDTIGAADFRISSIESDEVTFTWDQVGHPAMTIEYGPTGFTRGTGTTVTVNQSPYVLSGLDPLTNYKFYFDAVSQPGATGYCNTNYSDSATIFTPAGGTGCIDPTNFTADYTTCFYGTYGNPYTNTGIVDYGGDDIRSRHSVLYDPNATDPRTGGLLHTVPEGADASVRLGNWNSNSTSAEGEAITYSLFVDTNNFDLLVLKYAAVLQDPLHAPSDQPRFSLEVLDENGALLDAQCAAADFIANRNLGWNQAAGGVLWKDWTTVGVDMSPYANQTVRIRLTTRDCGEGNHYGYAYFTLECMTKNMRSELCGDVDSNTFYAPAGFTYRWYSSADTTDTISTEQSIRVATDTVTYYCECSFVDNSNCQFTISAYAGTRYPLAAFDYSVVISDCQFNVTFNNSSTISADGINPLGTGEPCESALWDFGDGTASANYRASHTYSAPGTYNVTLVSGIAGDVCTDTASMTLTLAFPPTSHRTLGTANICLGDTATFGIENALSFVWSDGNGDISRTVAPDTTTSWLCYVVDSNGCADTLGHTVTVFPISYNNVYETTVENLLPYTYINNLYYDDALDTVSLTNYVGCDSVVYFNLHVFRNVSANADSTICEGMLPFAWNGVVFDIDSTLTMTLTLTEVDTLSTTNGADSVLTMTLTVIPTTYADEYDTIVENQLPYSFNGATYIVDDLITPTTASLLPTLSDTVAITNVAGCDSLIHYRLSVHRNVSATADSAICQSELPLQWNGAVFDSTDFNLQLSLFNSTKTDTLLAASGADSVLTMNVTVHPVHMLTDTAVICENSLPYTWRDTTFGIATQTSEHLLRRYSVDGCDSITTLFLIVDTNTGSNVQQTIIQNQLPFVWNNVTFDSTDFDFTASASVFSSKSDTLVNAKGCDSVVVMTLHVNGNVSATADSTVCESQLPLQWNGVLFDTTDFNIPLSALNSTKSDTLIAASGADSVIAMTVTVIPTTYGTVGEHIDESLLPYSYHHHSYNSPVAGDTLHITNVDGCDSIVTYSLSVNYNIDSTVCESLLPLQWNGVLFDSTDFNHQSSVFSSTKTDTLAAVAGGDSVLTMTLTVIPTTYGDVTEYISESQLPYTYHQVIYGGPTASDTIVIANAAGCDSVVTYRLAVSYALDSAVCPSALPLQWNGALFNSTDFNTQLSLSSSTKSDTLASIGGGDSIVVMTLSLYPVYHHMDTSTLCRNMLPYTWRDTLLGSETQSGDFHLARQSTHGCDSLMSLHLTIGEVYAHYDSVTGCSSTSILVWRDTTISINYVSTNTATADRVTDYTLRRNTVLSCDSVMHLHLTVHPSYDLHDTAVICQNSLPYTWRDSVINPTDLSPHLHTIVQSNSSLFLCDSVCTLHLTVDTNTRSSVNLNIVENQLPYIFNGVSYTVADFDTPAATPQQSTIHDTVVITNHFGCDSIIHLALTLFYNTDTSLTESVCDNELPIIWNGVAFTGAATQSATLSTTHGADSVVVMTLLVNPTYHSDENATLCQSELPYTWHDTVFSIGQTSAMANRHFSTAHGCDSTFTLTLTVNSEYNTVDSIESCEPIVWIDGITYTNSTVGPQVTLNTVAGCDSLVTLNFRLSSPTRTYLDDSMCAGSVYYFHGREILNGGTYIDTLQTVDHCDSIVSLALTYLTHPVVGLNAVPDCESLTYTITATANVDHVEWNCEGGVWNPDWGPQNGLMLYVRPHGEQTFSFTADYLAEETCPTTKSITVDPIIQPLAQMQVTPDYLTYEQTDILAIDRSAGAIRHEWWIDGNNMGGEAQVSYTPYIFSDSVTIMLAVESKQCFDTAFHVVPIYRTALYTPNAFTPDESTNNHFFVQMDGVIDFELSIYNRTGLLVFHTTDPEEKWDGTFKGQKCPQANYVWIVRYTTIEKPRVPETRKGSVLLLR